MKERERDRGSIAYQGRMAFSRANSSWATGSWAAIRAMRVPRRGFRRNFDAEFHRKSVLLYLLATLPRRESPSASHLLPSSGLKIPFWSPNPSSLPWEEERNPSLLEALVGGALHRRRGVAQEATGQEEAALLSQLPLYRGVAEELRVPAEPRGPGYVIRGEARLACPALPRCHRSLYKDSASPTALRTRSARRIGRESSSSMVLAPPPLMVVVDMIAGSSLSPRWWLESKEEELKWDDSSIFLVGGRAAKKRVGFGGRAAMRDRLGRKERD